MIATEKLTVTPLIFRAAPLQSQEQTDDRRDKDGSAGGIKLLGTLFEADGCLVFARRRVEQECNTEDGHSTQGQVDVEAPSPRHVIRKGSTHQRASNGGEPIHGTNDSGVNRSFDQRHGVSHDDKGPREYPGSPDACDSTTNDEGN